MITFAAQHYLYDRANAAIRKLEDTHANVAASGRPATTPDIAKELATWEWRCDICDTATYLSGHGGVINSGPCGKQCPCTALQVYVILAGQRVHLGSSQEVVMRVTGDTFEACRGCKTPNECATTRASTHG